MKVNCGTLTGLAWSDLLRLKPAQFTDEVILITRHQTTGETGKTMIYEWNDDLRQAVATALAVRSAKGSDLLFCNRRGERYSQALTSIAASPAASIGASLNGCSPGKLDFNHPLMNELPNAQLTGT